MKFFLKTFNKRFAWRAFFLIWVLSQTVLFCYTFIWINNQTGLEPLRKVLGPWLSIAKASAALINFNSLLLLASMCKVCINYLQHMPIIGKFPWEKFLSFHRYCALSITVFSLLHIIAHYINATKLGNFSLKVPVILFASGVGITGHLLLVILIVVCGISISKSIKTWRFEIFWYIHQLGFLVYVFVLCLHGTFCFIKSNSPQGIKCSTPTSWRWMIGPMAVFLSEKLWRNFRSLRETKVVKVIAHPSKVLELQILKPSMRFTYGQYVYIKIPSIGLLQWHPFTITSIAQERYLSVHMRICGEWTRRVAAAFGVNFLSDGTIECLEVSSTPMIMVDGPFGDICCRVVNYQNVVLIGAGIGQTPFASILKHLW